MGTKKEFATCTLFFLSFLMHAQTEVILRKSFVDSIKNKVTYSGHFTIELAHADANDAVEDGDLHMAVKEKTIGLPIVAEIMNAAAEEDALALIHAKEGTNQKIHMTGAWRLYPEHPGHEDQEQGAPLPPYVNTNPDHVFEIHPITRVEGMDLVPSLHNIEGYDPTEAAKAFKEYNRVKGSIRKIGTKKIGISARRRVYNYAEFRIKLMSDSQKKVTDGRFVMAKILDKNNTVIDTARLAIVKDSKADKIIRNLGKGGKLHVLGIPRLNLAEISKRLEDSPANPSLLTDPLPVEMIVVGVLND
jgi:hypothetical protein